MKLECSLGCTVSIGEIKEFPKKTTLTIVANRARIVVTRYSCGAYYFKLPNDKVFRVAIRKWFPDWNLNRIISNHISL